MPEIFENEKNRTGEPQPEMSGTAEESLRAAEGLSAGPEMNNHPTEVVHPREPTGRHATDDWKKNRAKPTGGESTDAKSEEPEQRPESGDV